MFYYNREIDRKHIHNITRFQAFENQILGDILAEIKIHITRPILPGQKYPGS